jgi:predicted nucleic acid-binding protein
VTEPVVINASPLILLSRGGHLGLLQAFASEVWVPTPVAREIRQRGPTDITARALSTTDWLRVHPELPIPESIARRRLGAGESATLAIALEHRLTAIIDDLAGRRCAEGLGLSLRGTLGIVLAAKRRGLIPAARLILADLIAGGLYLSERVLDEALRRVGE